MRAPCDLFIVHRGPRLVPRILCAWLAFRSSCLALVALSSQSAREPLGLLLAPCALRFMFRDRRPGLTVGSSCLVAHACGPRLVSHVSRFAGRSSQLARAGHGPSPMSCVVLSDASPPCLPHPVPRAYNPRSVLAAHNSFLASRDSRPCLAVLPRVPSPRSFSVLPRVPSPPQPCSPSSMSCGHVRGPCLAPSSFLTSYDSSLVSRDLRVGLFVLRFCLAFRLSFASRPAFVHLANNAALPSMIRGLVLTPVQRDVIRCQPQKTTLF